MKPMNWLAIVAIRFYQGAFSKFLTRRGVRCLHYPSCSQYGIIAFQKHGFFHATLLTWRRFRDCNPFSGRPYIDFP